MSDLLYRVAEDGGDAAGVAIGVDEGGSLDAIVALPFDCEAGIGLLQMDRFGIAVPGQTDRQWVGDVEQPGITGVGGKQDELTDGDDTAVVICDPQLLLSIEYSAWTWNGSSSCLRISCP